LKFLKKKFITARYVHPLFWRAWGSSPYSLRGKSSRGGLT
jgi:hypothetical protein